jgi:hypothetical protein
MLTAAEEQASPSSRVTNGWELGGLEEALEAYQGSGEAIEGDFVNEDVPWRWVWVCLCGHAELVLREEDTGMVGSSSSLFWHQSRRRPAISSCREEGAVVRGERADLVEGGSVNLKQQAGREGTVVWVEMMMC